MRESYQNGEMEPAIQSGYSQKLIIHSGHK